MVMFIPIDIFTIILEFACDYNKHHLETHRKNLLTGLSKVSRQITLYDVGVYDDYGNDMSYVRLVWFLDRKTITKFLTNDKSIG